VRGVNASGLNLSWIKLAMAAHRLDRDGHRLRSFPLFLTAVRDDGLHFAAPDQLYPGNRLE
jgi:hypothetical protein